MQTISSFLGTSKALEFTGNRQSYLQVLKLLCLIVEVSESRLLWINSFNLNLSRVWSPIMDFDWSLKLIFRLIGAFHWFLLPGSYLGLQINQTYTSNLSIHFYYRLFSTTLRLLTLIKVSLINKSLIFFSVLSSLFLHKYFFLLLWLCTEYSISYFTIETSVYTIYEYTWIYIVCCLCITLL